MGSLGLGSHNQETLAPSVSPSVSLPLGPQLASGPCESVQLCLGGFWLKHPLGRSLPSLAVGRQPEAPRQPPGLLLPRGPASVPAVTMHEEDEWHSCRGPEGMRWGRFGHCPLSQQPGIGWNH